MFNNLQVESKLDILKCLNIKQLISVRQTNYYFNYLIGRYEGELACKKLLRIEIIEFYHSENYNKFINIEDGLFKLKITDQLIEKWQSALDRQIPIYLNISRKSQKIIRIFKNDNWNSLCYLNLPTIPKNIEEIKIIRCWIEKISLCYFDFYSSIFNPEFIQLIFENEEMDKIKFNCRYFANYSDITDETTLFFYLNRIIISDNISLYYNFDDNTFNQQTINILFKFLLKIPYVSIYKSKQITLCKMVLNYIETSKDYSNMVDYIIFDCSWPKFNLSERAEFVGMREVFPWHTRQDRPAYEKELIPYYQLTNKHNPKIKFYISYLERNELILCFEIQRITRKFLKYFKF